MPRHRSFNETTCESQDRIEMAHLKRYGYLEGYRRPMRWTRNGQTVSAINVTGNQGGILIEFAYVNGQGDRVPVSQYVPFSWTPTNFGGRRQWLTCPRCRRPMGILYGRGNVFACRKCHGLQHASKYETSFTRAIDLANKIRRKLGGTDGAFDLHPLPPKPKRMRHATYDRLEHRYDDLIEKWQAGAYAFFGRL